MKKKALLFVVLIAIACCIFAITASAAEIPNWTEITEVEGIPDKSTFGADGKAGATSRVLMSDGKTYPAYYICSNSSTLTMDFSKLSGYDASDVIAIEIPKGVTTVSNALRTYASLEAVIIPEGCTEIAGTAFKGNTSITYVELPSTLVTVGASAFESCTSITTVYSKAKTIGEKMFYNCNLIDDLVLENTITINNHAFCTPNQQLALASVVFPEGLTKIGSYAFPRAQFTEIVLPSTLSEVGGNAFNGCSKLEKAVVLGSAVGDSMFNGCSKLKVLVLTPRLTTVGTTNPLNNVSSTFTTFYTGTDYDRVTDKLSMTSRINTAKIYTYDAYTQGGTTGSYKLIYGCNVCTVAFGGVHTEPVDDKNCTTASVCTVCSDYTYKEALEHLIIENITYASFMEKGEHSIYCDNDGCEYGETSVTNELFTCQGYSIPENNREGLAVCYKFDSAAMAEYKRVTKNTVEFGVFAVLKDKIGTNELFKEDGSLKTNSVCASLTDKEFTTVALRIVGFTTAESKTLELAMGAFVKEVKDGKAVYSYLQAHAPESGQKYSFISYNQVLEQ